LSEHVRWRIFIGFEEEDSNPFSSKSKSSHLASQPRFTKLLLMQRIYSVSPVIIGRCRSRTKLKL